MKTLLVYESTHGCTEKCAVRLHGLLAVKPEIIRLRRIGRINVNNYNTVIIGGSIHAGTMQSRVRNFLTSNVEKLKNKRLGLFVCCMEEGKKAEDQFNNSFPEELRERAVARGIFGGEFDFDRMNFFQRAIVRKVKGINESVSNIVDEEIVRFAENINSSHRFRKKA
ncbi:MAG TPA: flavodoxin domain-containing protein [Bacteroidales bacterium]|nr:flavodoxin domain-containing protein [Bacteroidales bacterium]